MGENELKNIRNSFSWFVVSHFIESYQEKKRPSFARSSSGRSIVGPPVQGGTRFKKLYRRISSLIYPPPPLPDAIKYAPIERYFHGRVFNSFYRRNAKAGRQTVYRSFPRPRTVKTYSVIVYVRSCRRVLDARNNKTQPTEPGYRSANARGYGTVSAMFTGRFASERE